MDTNYDAIVHNSIVQVWFIVLVVICDGSVEMSVLPYRDYSQYKVFSGCRMVQVAVWEFLTDALAFVIKQFLY